MENKTPQLEDGYTRIAHKVLIDLASYRLSGEEWQALLCIFYKTYGFHKKEDWISLSQFYELTGMKKPSIIRALKKLINKNIVSKRANGKIILYSYNKLKTTWKPLAKKLIVSKRANDVSKSANKSLQKSYPHKIQDNNTKDNISINTYTYRSNDQFGNKYVNFILEEFKRNVGISPIDSNARNIAHNIFQLTNTFAKNYGKIYKEKRNEEVTLSGFVTKAWIVYRKNNGDHLPQRLKTFKEHYKGMLEQLSISLTHL